MENFESSTGESGVRSTVTEFEKLLEEQTDKFRPGSVVPGTVVEIGREVVAVDIGFKSEGIVPIEQFYNTEGKVAVGVGDRVDVFIVATENDDGQVVVSREKAEQKKVWDSVEEAFKNNQIISGRVVQKVKGGLQVDIGIPAFLPGSQVDVRPHKHLDKFIGQTFDFVVLKITREKGNIVLSRRAVLLNERDVLRAKTLEVMGEGVVMEGTVKNITDYGAFIDLGGVDGLVHITDISWGRVNHPSEKLSVGQIVPVVVLKYDTEKQRVSLGMKQLKADPWVNAAERFPVGTRSIGKVVGLADYGAFVELEDGIEGLVHVSDLTWSKKARHPSKILSEGQQVEVQVLEVDTEQKKISLGLKQTLANPWETLKDRLPIGSRVTGKVRTIADFGVFIGVEDGIDGLVHVSDFSWTNRVKDPEEIKNMFKKGDEIEAVVLDIDVANERLSLGIKQLDPDPWEAISQRYPVGSRVKGKVTSVADFGVFVALEEGIEGLVHNTQLDVEKGGDVAAAYPIGNVVEAEVMKVDKDVRRISLSARTIKDREEREQMSQYTGDFSLGNFGELLKKKLGGNEE